ncbi:MAG: heparinase II/III-family protein [Clostridia bacterium]|nr:heparinase II/III-family protein [Clostridia bacterium]
MFQKWLEHNKLSDYFFSTRLFPPASDRAFWEKTIGKEAASEAEAYLGYSWPLILATQFMEFQISGNRLVQEIPHFARRFALTALFLGELSEGKGRFLPDITDGIFLICEESYWGLSAHNITARKKDLLPRADDPYIDLFAAETAELLAVIYHVLYEELKNFCPLILDRIEYELDRRILTPYQNHYDFFWMGYRNTTVNNWNAWITSNILTVLLLFPQRKTRHEQILNKLFAEIQKYYDSIPSDGGCDEGSSYWTKAGAKLFSFCDLLYRTTDGQINFFCDPKLKEIALYEARVWIDGCRFVNFGDGNGSVNVLLDYSLFGFGERIGEPSLCQLAAVLKKNRKKTSFSELFRGCGIKEILFSYCFKEKIDAIPPMTAPKRSILPNLQNAVLREGAWLLAAKGGHNKENHNHNDVGSFLLYHEGKPLLIDPGCGTYTRQTFGPERYTIWTMQSAWHNLPTVGTYDQLVGAEFKAEHFDLCDQTLEISFSEAYPPEAGLKEVRRFLTLTEEGLFWRDRFVFKKDPLPITENLITLYSPQKHERGLLLGDAFLLETDLPWEAQYLDFNKDAKLENSWETKGLWRIRLMGDGKEKAEFTFHVRKL